MKILIPLLIGGIFSSIYSGFFLLTYYRLLRGGCRATGLISSFDRSHFFDLRQLYVPVVRFQTSESTWIESQPKHSVFHELNQFKLHRRVQIHYQKDSPSTFIIQSRLEELVNWLVIGFTFCAIGGWLLL